MTPKISVLLPAYNAQTYLRESIESILTQTFQDFELIIINDGSTDRSLEIMSSFTDKRIRIINQNNAGLPISLNRAITLSQGKYLARQDADDISMPTRLSEQFEYMESHPECALLGGWADILLENTPSERYLRHPYLNGDIQVKLHFFNCFVHSSVMIRKCALEQAGLYPEEREKFPPEDYDLWLRIADKFQVANLPKTLLLYREVPNSISRIKLDLMQERARLMSFTHLQKQLNHSSFNQSLPALIRAMTNEKFNSPQRDKFIHLEILKKISQIQLIRFPAEREIIEKSYKDCEKLLYLAYQKMSVEKLSQYLPINIMPFLKKIKSICRR